MKLLYKNKQIKRNNDSIVKMIMPSLVGIGVCITCLLGTTFAWFTDNAYTSTQSIEFANYGLNIEIEGEDNIVEGDDVTYILSQKREGQGYKVTITATGTASTGFCTINDNMITEQINQGETFTFILYPDEDNKEYTFTSIWGTPSEYSKISKIKNGDIVGTPLVENSMEEVNNNINNNTNNNLSIPNVGNVESTTSQPENVETITPSEEPEVEEDNEITESDSSDTGSNNSDIILDTTEETSEESETDTTN